MPLGSLELLAILARIFIIIALAALLLFNGRVYATVRQLDVEMIKSYIKLTKYLLLFAGILFFQQFFYLLQWMHTWGFITLPLSTSELGIIGSIYNILLVMGLLPIIIVLFNSHRMFGHLARSMREGILLDVRTFQSMKDRLSKIYGTSSQSMIMYAMGKEVGQRKATDIVKRLPKEKPEDFIKGIFRLEQILGWGKFEVVSSEPKKFVVRIYDCFEHMGAKGEKPQCDYTAGFLAGIYVATYGLDSVASELKCASQGDPYCEFCITIGELPVEK